MSVTKGKVTIDKIAMLVMAGAVIAFVVAFLVSMNPQNWITGEVENHGFCRNYNWSCNGIDVNNCVLWN